jgi:hypothetical protein
LFSLPFDREAAEAFVLQLEDEPEPPPGFRFSAVRPYVGVAALVGAAAGAGVGTYYVAKSHSVHGPTDEMTDQQATEARNRRIRSYDRRAAWLFGVAGVATATGLLLLLWPSSSPAVAVAPADGGATIQLTLRR